MSQATYAAQQSKIEKKIERLKRKSERLRDRRRTPAIASIVRMMREHGLTPDDIADAVRSGPGEPSRIAPVRSTKRASARLYRHPQTGDVWGGRGRPPKWLILAERSGATRDSFLL